jgi:AraC-like DNA-binding protein
MAEFDFRIRDVRTPLGRIALGGRFLEHTGTPLVRDWQVRGAYSLACVTRGRGLYYDVFGRFQELEVGDLILVFPDIGHRYGPEGTETWDECFLIFDGPIFDLWRAVGLLRPSASIIRLGEEASLWCTRVLERMEALQSEPTVNHFQHLVEAMLAPFSCAPPADVSATPDWLVRAQARLDQLDENVEIEPLAAEMGIAARTLRRQFHRATGLSPQQYRDERRLRAALEMLTHAPGIKLRTVALQIGFADEYYFSRWFKRKVGVAPHQWRSGAPASLTNGLHRP